MDEPKEHPLLPALPEEHATDLKVSYDTANPSHLEITGSTDGQTIEGSLDAILVGVLSVFAYVFRRRLRALKRWLTKE